MKTYVYKTERWAGKPTTGAGKLLGVFVKQDADDSDEAFTEWLNAQGAQGWLVVAIGFGATWPRVVTFVRGQPMGLR